MVREGSNDQESVYGKLNSEFARLNVPADFKVTRPVVLGWVSEEKEMFLHLSC